MEQADKAYEANYWISIVVVLFFLHVTEKDNIDSDLIQTSHVCEVYDVLLLYVGIYT